MENVSKTNLRFTVRCNISARAVDFISAAISASNPLS